MKDENVSTGTLDSQDWEMVTEMVEDTENAATHFMQGKHVIDLEKKKVGGKDKHIFWARTECGLVLSSVTPWELNHQ